LSIIRNTTLKAEIRRWKQKYDVEGRNRGYNRWLQ